MERADLLKDNGKIFIDTGKAMNDNAKRTCKTLVVGNPANTNCLILSHYAPGIPRENFTAMTMLDHLRAQHQLAHKVGARVTDIRNFAVWGNHSPTMYPDINHATINGKKATTLVDEAWTNNTFIPTVQKRGAAIIDALGKSSAASAANAAIEHMRLWTVGSADWTSFSIHSKGNTYGIDQNLIFSFPVTIKGGKYTAVKGLSFTDEGKARLKKTEAELLDERKAVENLLH
jgi:malate dehydrogenase